MKCALAIFAKTVGLSPVKTRLAAEIGQQKAEEFYRLSVRAVEAVAKRVAEKSPLVPHWVLAEKEAPTRHEWREFPALWTGDGGLGARLANVAETLFSTHDAVMFIGTDSPQLSPARLMEAVALVKARPDDCICGPAEDGGFYLFSSAKPLEQDVWQSVTYSVETTLEELKDRSGRRFYDLPAEQDVDVYEDLERLYATLADTNTVLLIEQVALKVWLENYLDVAV